MFNTPSHHRVHHDKNPKYLDANYAGTLVIWDKMFGTFIPEDIEERPDYCLVKDSETYGPFRILIHEYLSIANDIIRRDFSLRERLPYIVAPPGLES